MVTNEMAIFTFTSKQINLESAGFLPAQVRLPEQYHDDFKSKLLLGIKQHEYIICHAYFDEVNYSFPFVKATVLASSIRVESLIPGFRTVTFITE